MVHKSELLVKDALSKPRRERLQMFATFRKNAIYKYNLEQLQKHDSNLLRQKVKPGNQHSIVMCTKCKGFYAKNVQSQASKRMWQRFMSNASIYRN